MDVIISYDRTMRYPGSVNTATVAKLAPAKMMDMIVFYQIMMCRGRDIFPTPTDGYAGEKRLIVITIVVNYIPLQVKGPMRFRP